MLNLRVSRSEMVVAKGRSFAGINRWQMCLVSAKKSATLTMAGSIEPATPT
jgi:hypothetical protein